MIVGNVRMPSSARKILIVTFMQNESSVEDLVFGDRR
jgi:hypothetical protein